MPDFFDDAETIREWIDGGGVDSDALVQELITWADFFSFADEAREVVEGEALAAVSEGTPQSKGNNK